MKSNTLNLCIDMNHPYYEKYKKNADLYNEKSQQNKLLDSGFDLFVPPNNKIIRTNNYVVSFRINHNIQCSVTDDNENFYPSLLCPRSSISNYPLRMANSYGIIDAGYRGDLIAAVDYFSDLYTFNTANENCNIIDLDGLRLFQLCNHNHIPFKKINIVTELNITERNKGGFGSTGL